MFVHQLFKIYKSNETHFIHIAIGMLLRRVPEPAQDGQLIRNDQIL